MVRRSKSNPRLVKVVTYTVRELAEAGLPPNSRSRMPIKTINGIGLSFVPRATAFRPGSMDGAIADIRDAESSREGFVGLQVHGIEKETGPFQVRWRDIRIRELK